MLLLALLQELLLGLLQQVLLLFLEPSLPPFQPLSPELYRSLFRELVQQFLFPECCQLASHQIYPRHYQLIFPAMSPLPFLRV